jgi:hypothetical protein
VKRPERIDRYLKSAAKIFISFCGVSMKINPFLPVPSNTGIAIMLKLFPELINLIFPSLKMCSVFLLSSDENLLSFSFLLVTPISDFVLYQKGIGIILYRTNFESYSCKFTPADQNL